MSLITKAWCVFIMFGTTKYYAHSSETQPIPRGISWHSKQDSYPEHYTEAEALKIAQEWADQKPKMEAVILQKEEV